MYNIIKRSDNSFYYSNDGYLYDKMAIIEYMVHQKKLIAKKMKEYEKQLQKNKVIFTVFLIFCVALSVRYRMCFFYTWSSHSLYLIRSRLADRQLGWVFLVLSPANQILVIVTCKYYGSAWV